MRYLILSVDYEVFGNGTGDVRQHIIRPAERMAGLCRQYQVPLTVFFEVEEYLAFKKYSEALKTDLGYDPGSLIRDQIVRFAQHGHDVQLHLHPEWVGARYRDGRWALNPEKCAVDDLFDTQVDVDRYIAERKAVIDEMLSTVLPARRVRAYRAGAFSAQPGRKLLSALAKNDILIDSSVVKGLTRLRPSSAFTPASVSSQSSVVSSPSPGPFTNSTPQPPRDNSQSSVVSSPSPGPFTHSTIQPPLGSRPSAFSLQPSAFSLGCAPLVLDYRNAPGPKGPWRVREDVSREDASGPIWEFPIYSIRGRRWNQLTFKRLRAKFSRNVPKDRQRAMVTQLGVRKNPFSMLRFLLQPVPIKLDFHNVSPGTLLNWIRNAPRPPAGTPDVVVLIGHTKEHVDDASFERLLQLIASDSTLKIVGFSHLADMVQCSTASESFCASDTEPHLSHDR